MLQVLPPLYSFMVDKYPGGNPNKDPVKQAHYALLPHEVFAELAARAPKLFEHLMSGPRGNLDSWWQAAASAAKRAGATWFDAARTATDNVEANNARAQCVRQKRTLPF